MNTKTSETNAQVAERMANAYDRMIEANSNTPTVAEPIVSPEERKVILKSIAKVAGNSDGENLVKYVDTLAEGISNLSA